MGDEARPRRKIGGGWHLIHFLLACSTSGLWVPAWLFHAYRGRKPGSPNTQAAQAAAISNLSAGSGGSKGMFKLLAGCFVIVPALLLSAGLIEMHRAAEAERVHLASLSPEERSAYLEAQEREKAQQEAEREAERARAARVKAERDAAHATAVAEAARVEAKRESAEA